MQPHQVRVVDEKEELDGRHDKLRVFIDSSPIFAALDEQERGRLNVQVVLMKLYGDVLGDRIQAFE